MPLKRIAFNKRKRSHLAEQLESGNYRTLCGWPRDAGKEKLELNSDIELCKVCVRFEPFYPAVQALRQKG